MRRGIQTGVLMAIALCCLCLSSRAETIILNSGNAPIGQRDPLVSVYGTVARQQAWVIACPGYWVSPIPGTQWLSVSSNGCGYGTGGVSDYYEVTFVLPAGYVNPRLTVTYSADDRCDNLLLNGNPWGGSGGFTDRGTYSTDDPNFFRTGGNVLGFPVINANYGASPNPTGVDFCAEVSYQVVPEPPGVLALVFALGGLGGSAKRRSCGRRRRGKQLSQRDPRSADYGAACTLSTSPGDCSNNGNSLAVPKLGGKRV